MIYEIMHKDDRVTVANFSFDGKMEKFTAPKDKELVPLWDK